ncbi:FMN-dependent NADH-azoreductase [uncultured Desulfuromusa sp.]|uniref:FMN-dependent NADH-azoreductase n=1 Tax=uncultured Desulfuromusa sp. TaxID=219183 RepID=UPI002AA7AA8D|nr:FMN-dependent NADH-azoreductase [uncultured Desulfuromusa sp.]
MKKLLAISSSPGRSHSYSRNLVHTFVDKFSQKEAEADVIIRDLVEQPIPHLDDATISAFYTPLEQLSDEQKKILALSDKLINELESADVIVIGTPMHNFSIPSGLKSYIDHVARVGRTFHYTDNGPQGLLQGKKVYILTTRGGNYSQMPMAAFDHQEPYLRTILGFIGMNDIEFIHAQGMSMGEEKSKQAVEQAIARISKTVDDLLV